MNRVRVMYLALSAAGIIALASSEGYEPVARPPLPGDKPTLGFGATENVRAGETTTPVRALIRLLDDANTYERAVKRCVMVPLYQHEFDAYVSFAYNMGVTRFCNANFVKTLNAGNYEAACIGMATHPDGSPAWSYFQGVYVEGLQQRRRRERDLCLGVAK